MRRWLKISHNMFKVKSYSVIRYSFAIAMAFVVLLFCLFFLSGIVTALFKVGVYCNVQGVEAAVLIAAGVLLLGKHS